MANTTALGPRAQAVIGVLYYLVGFGFFAYLINYYVATAGGPTLLAFTLVPVTFILFTLDALRKNDLYPKLGGIPNILIGAAYIAASAVVATYLHREFQAIGTVRAGFWNTTDIVIGATMFLLVLEYARKRYFVLFLLNVVLIVYAVYGSYVPGMFSHPGLSWYRILTMMSLETTTGIFSSLPQLALTLIGSFILVLSVLRAFGSIDSILKGTSHLAARSPYALPQSAMIGSLAVASVSGSGAANAVTTGSATIPALIAGGMPREHAASVETSASLGGQLMPPIMGISAFLMADFLGVSYFDVVARGYAPAIIYFLGVALGVYFLSIRFKSSAPTTMLERLTSYDILNLLAFVGVVAGLILFMSVAREPPLFAALYVFYGLGSLLLGRALYEAWLSVGRDRLRALGKPLLRALDNFTTMTADLTLLLATLAILTSAFVNTGVPTKVGSILVAAAGVNLASMALMAFAFGALLGMGLPPAPTYIITGLVIAPHMIRAGVDPWPVHFFAFFLAVWGELTPPTSVVAAVTSRIAEADFLKTLLHALRLCSPLFVLMAGVLVHPELVIEPGVHQLVAIAVLLMATAGLVFTMQTRMSSTMWVDFAIRGVLGLLSAVVLLHPSLTVSAMAAVPALAIMAYWLVVRRGLPDAV